MLHRRRGFTLGLVLIVMIVLIGLSAVIMDITTNYAGTSRSVVEREELFNAAQSGVEWGKAWLLSNVASLDVEEVTDVDELYDLKAKLDDGTYHPDFNFSDPDINVSVYMYYCNYTTNISDPVSKKLPPIYADYYSSQSSQTISEEGQSGFIDPNRNILGTNTKGGRVFVVRSFANAKNKKTGIEAMVVIPNADD